MRNKNKMKELLALIVVVVLFFLCIPRVFAKSVAFQDGCCFEWSRGAF